jgi:fibronectin type 3 domain-containing protein
LSATGAGGQIELNWANNTEGNIDGYNVFRSDKSDGVYEKISTETTNDYIDIIFTPITTFYYIITAVSEKGYESEKSVVVSATTLDKPEPMSFYDFEEVAGVAVTDSGTAKNNGTLLGTEISRATGGIIYSGSDDDGCIEITGSPYSGTSHFEVPFADFHNSSNYTYSGWVKWTHSKSDWAYLFWQNGLESENRRHVDMWWWPEPKNIVASVLHNESGDEVRIHPEAQENINMFDGKWHQVAITLKNDTIIRMWADGQLIEQKISDNPIAKTDTTNNLWVGCMPAHGSSESLKMIGFIDRIRIYNIALSEGEIKYLYESEAPIVKSPTTPTGFSATGGLNKIDLNWDDNTDGDFTNYVLMRSDTQGGAYTEIANNIIYSEYVDTELPDTTTYYYKVKVVNENGDESENSAEVFATTLADPTSIKSTAKPSGFKLMQNRPNPFSSGTTIEYELQVSGSVELKIIDIFGRVVTTLEKSNKQPGYYKVDWNPNSIIPGIYLYKITVSSSKGTFSNIKKMVFTK